MFLPARYHLVSCAMDWKRLRPGPPDGVRPTRARRSLFHRFKSPRNESDEVPKATSKPTPEPQCEPQPKPPIPSKFGIAWLKGEQKLRDDTANTPLLKKYNEILGSELDIGIDLESLEPAVRNTVLEQVLKRKIQELEAKKLTILLGCTPGFEKGLKDVFQNLLRAKDLISGAASASPPASIACAGIAVILTVSCYPSFALRTSQVR
jgi:hypothetical protein